MSALGCLARDAARAVELTEVALRQTVIERKDLVVSAMVLRVKASKLLEQILVHLHAGPFTGQAAALQKIMLRHEDSHIRSFINGKASPREMGVLREVLKLAHVVFEAEVKDSVSAPIGREGELMSAVEFTKAEAVKRLAKKIDLSKLTKDQARVEIAKDVIAGIKSKTLRATHSYAELQIAETASVRARSEFNAATDTWDAIANAGRKVDWKEVLNLPKVTCDVCAIGACFAATVRRENKFSSETGSYVEREEIVDRMGRYFSPKQLDCLEAAYESGYYKWNESDDRFSHGDPVAPWRRFGRELGREDDERMIALMQYIIKCHGKIVTPKAQKEARTRG